MKFMEALRYKPARLWMLDDSSPFQDYSGYAGSATLTGTEKKGFALVPDAVYSQVLQSDKTIVFDSPVYRAGTQEQPFSLIAVGVPVYRTDTGPQRILSKSGSFDGLSIDGTVVSFSTKYTSNGEAKCSFDLDHIRRVDLAGVHTQTKNFLFVDGVLVASVDITEAQQADTYVSPDNNLYAGGTTSTQGFMLNRVGIYQHALLSEEVERIFVHNKKVPGDIPKMLNGRSLYVSTLARPTFLDTEWVSEEDWTHARMTGVSIDNGRLVPDRLDGLTVEGVWRDEVPLDAAAGVPVHSMVMQWVGENVTIEVSVDDATWETVVMGANLTTIPEDFDPTDKALSIRATFAEGEASGYLDSLRLLGYSSDQYVPPVGRTITFENPIATLDEYNPLEFRDDWGSNIINGSLEFSADSSDEPTNPQTIEVWMRKNVTTAPTFSFSGTTYINGGNSTTPTVGEWALYHFVLAAPVSTFTISGNIAVGRVAIYPTALTAGQAEDIYESYKGQIKLPIVDTAVIAIAEPPASIDIYAHDWEIVAS